MKCPIFVMGQLSNQIPAVGSNSDCIKEECAWWVKASESCTMEAIPRITGYLGSELKAIKDKMPSPEFFKK